MEFQGRHRAVSAFHRKSARPASGATSQVRTSSTVRQFCQHASECRKNAAMLARTELAECSTEGTAQCLTRTT